MRIKHSCKNFSDDGKDESRRQSVILPIIDHFGKLPDGKIIISTSGLYSLDRKRLELYQYLKAGIICSHDQFLGVDNGTCKGRNVDIVTDNIRNYGKGTEYYVPFEQGEIEFSCYKHRNEIGFINLDLQNGIPLSFPVFIKVLEAMKGIHNFGIAFNSMLSTAHTTYMDHFKTVKEEMPRLFTKHLQKSIFLDDTVEELLKPYRLIKMDAYDGTGKSSTVMGTYVFFKE